MDTPSENSTEAKVETGFVDELTKAGFAFLKVVFYFIVLPYKIWIASLRRMAGLSKEALVGKNEEFPVYTFVKAVFDTLIFIAPVLVVIVALVRSMDYYSGFGGFVLTVIGGYFGIIGLSLLKELYIIPLMMFKKLEAITENTKK